MTIVPTPAAGDIPFNQPVTKTLGPLEQATVRYRPRTNPAEFYLPIVAISKQAESSYEVKLDDKTVYGPASVPPTDVDDLSATFIPARQFSQTLEVIVTNLSETTSRTYTVQPVGWENAN